MRYHQGHAAEAALPQACLQLCPPPGSLLAVAASHVSHPQREGGPRSQASRLHEGERGEGLRPHWAPAQSLEGSARRAKQRKGPSKQRSYCVSMFRYPPGGPFVLLHSTRCTHNLRVSCGGPVPESLIEGDVSYPHAHRQAEQTRRGRRLLRARKQRQRGRERGWMARPVWRNLSSSPAVQLIRATPCGSGEAACNRVRLSWRDGLGAWCMATAVELKIGPFLWDELDV